jgi:hypothetical protein
MLNSNPTNKDQRSICESLEKLLGLITTIQSLKEQIEQASKKINQDENPSNIFEWNDALKLKTRKWDLMDMKSNLESLIVEASDEEIKIARLIPVIGIYIRFQIASDKRKYSVRIIDLSQTTIRLEINLGYSPIHISNELIIDKSYKYLDKDDSLVPFAYEN